jgi:hypothetical protein
MDLQERTVVTELQVYQVSLGQLVLQEQVVRMDLMVHQRCLVSLDQLDQTDLVVQMVQVELQE